jgi:hypothetical protein
MRTTFSLSGASVALGLALSPATAAADSTTAPVRPFVMSDLSGLTYLGVDTQLTRWELPSMGDDTSFLAFNFDLVAEVAVAPHWVLLGRLPLSYVDVEELPPVFETCCGFALGNATLGVRGLTSGRSRSGARSVFGGELSASLPTASDGGESAAASASTALAQLPHDPGRYLPDTTTLRLAGGAQLYGRRFLVQAGGGLDAFLYSDSIDDDDSDFALRLGVAAGFRATPQLAILAELSGLLFLDDGAGSTRNDGIAAADIGLRYGGDSVVFGVRAYLPIDGQLNDYDMIGLGADLGVRL